MRDVQIDHILAILDEGGYVEATRAGIQRMDAFQQGWSPTIDSHLPKPGLLADKFKR